MEPKLLTDRVFRTAKGLPRLNSKLIHSATHNLGGALAIKSFDSLDKPQSGSDAINKHLDYLRSDPNHIHCLDQDQSDDLISRNWFQSNALMSINNCIVYEGNRPP
jgi:hypothetical protein